MNRKRFAMFTRLALVGVALGWAMPQGAWAQWQPIRQAKVKFTQAEREAAARRARAAREARASRVTKGGVSSARAAAAAPVQGGVPDYFGTYPNWAYSPPLKKFVDTLPGLGAGNANNLGTYLPVANPDIVTYPGSDYYEIELVEYTQQMHQQLLATTLRGYRQTNNGTNTAVCGTNCTAANNTVAPPARAYYLGPVIVATRNRPVRIKFTNNLPTGAAGKLFLPVDYSVMGSGPAPTAWTGVEAAAGICATAPGQATPAECFTENRATIHLHGGRTPWISDGTPHQWIVPASENTAYTKGQSVFDVPDMPPPGAGSQTFYFSNQQSARLMFYHDHASGLTRLNVYAGEAAGYLITDDTETSLVGTGPGKVPAEQIPLVIQDKTFVDASTILATDPTWNWGTGAIVAGVRTPKTGDLWWPHVYVPAQNPYDISGVNPTGRWAYGPWFWPPTTNILFPPVANPIYDPLCDPDVAGYCQPPENPGTPNASWGAEAFMDTPVVNGTAFPSLTVQPKAYRFRILNAAHDRFLNLQLYEADAAVTSADGRTNTEVKMVPATVTPGFPPLWPTDGRAGGVPDPITAGPPFIQIGTEGGFLPRPAVIQQQPITWNTDPTTFNAGNVQDHALLLGPAERADVIIDFAAYAGKTLILYNDAPAAFPALDPRLDYYTGAPDLTATGGHPGPQAGFGPNTRTIMQIKVEGTAQPAFDLTALNTAWATVFASGQEPIIVGQKAYNGVYPGVTFPSIAPYWGVSNIQSTSLGFKNTAGVNMTVPMQPKAIQDEMGETFDDYGRMSAQLGIELPNTNAQNQNFVLQKYVDPPTEVIMDSVNSGPAVAGDGTQIWKITHNGVDTHPVHFHVFDVQLINRVGWDGIIRLPDANELGWKDTVRISPLEDTIVALRPWAPKMPFGIPDSVRSLNPALPSISTVGFTNIDPLTGQALATPTTNMPRSLGWEYVWHCHILSHEEADMMRIVRLEVNVTPPAAPVLSRVGNTLPVNLSWTDATPVGPNPNAPANLGSPANEIGFKVERALIDSTGTPGAYSQIGAALANATTYSDATPDGTAPFSYRVIAYNAAGSVASNAITVPATVFPPAAPSGVVVSAVAGPGVKVDWTDNSNNETGFRVQRATNVQFTANLTGFGIPTPNTTTYTDNTVVAGTTYYYRVIALNGTLQSAPSNIVSITVSGGLSAPSNLSIALLAGPQVRLNWIDNSTGETGFMVERAADAAFTTITSIPVPTPNATTFTDTTVAANNTYYYRVRAVNGTMSNPSNTALAAPPQAPTNITVSQAVGATNVIVRWTDNATNEAGFNVERSVNGGAYAAKPNAPARTGTGLVTYSDPRSTFTPGQSLRYRVRSFNPMGSSVWLELATPIVVH